MRSSRWRAGTRRTKRYPIAARRQPKRCVSVPCPPWEMGQIAAVDHPGRYGQAFADDTDTVQRIRDGLLRW